MTVTVSNFQLRKATVGSPATYNAIEELDSISGVGRNNQLADKTNFDSAGAMEYVAGLSDGSEVEFTANYVPGATYQEAFMNDCDNQLTVNFQLAYTAQSPERLVNFAAVCLDYEFQPSATEVNKMRFKIKITGSLTRTP